MDTNTAATVSLSALALELSAVKGEADQLAAIESLIGKPAVYTTDSGTDLVGVIEAPITGPASTGGYPIIRFADGRWARTDDAIVLVNTAA